MKVAPLSICEISDRSLLSANQILHKDNSMPTDIAALSVRELDVLMAKVKQRKAALKKRKPSAAVRKRMAALVAKEGYSLSELLGGRDERSKGVAPRAAGKKGQIRGASCRE